MTLLTNLKALGSITDLVHDTKWSADHLRQAILVRAVFLKEQNIGPGSLVLISHGGTPHFFADLLAIWQLGAGAACLNPTLTENELINIANFVGPKALLRGPDETPKELVGVLEFDLENEEREAGKDLTFEEFDRNTPALILFTSGTTGDPKGVVHTFHSITERLKNNWDHLSKDTLSKTLSVLPTHFGHGLIGNCLTPLFADCDLYLYPRPGIAGAANLGTVIDENEISFMSSVPSFWKVVLKASKKPQGGSLKQVSVGSAPLTAEHWQSIQNWAGIKNVVNMYGITETANWVAGVSGATTKPVDGLVGKMWGGEVNVLPKDGSQQPTGEGEILLKTPAIMKGYLKRPDLTAEVLSNGWYNTGDWGSVSERGEIRLLGRTKTEINKAGIKILPEEIDMLLERHPGVVEACAFGVPDLISGETVAVAVTLKEDSTLGISDLRNWCRDKIRPDGVPEKWFLVDEIPKTDRGKINRGVVREYCLNKEQNK